MDEPEGVVGGFDSGECGGSSQCVVLGDLDVLPFER